MFFFLLFLTNFDLCSLSGEKDFAGKNRRILFKESFWRLKKKLSKELITKTV